MYPDTILVKLATASAMPSMMPSTAAGMPSTARKPGRITVVVS